MRSLLLFFIISTCAIIYIDTATVPKNEDSELVLVSVIFRHGARTTYSFYPNDPNINETFYPIGLGGLTNEGKLGEYQLGRYLRNLYGDFLGEDYTEQKVYVRSTDVTRTKMSAQLVLAGLFPPSKIQKWNTDLDWQPIPVEYKKEKEEDLFHPTKNCPYKKKVLADLPNRPEIQEKYILPYRELYDFIQNKSGKEMNTPSDMQDFFFIIKTEKDMNLPVPDWTDAIFPEQVHEAASVVYNYHNFDTRVKKINAGYLLDKILGDANSKIAATIHPERKIFLYSGHESTLGYMLDALNVISPHIPPYGSAISFELHKDSEQYYIKLRYRNDTDAVVPVDLIIPGCELLCPIDRFMELQSNLLPQETIQEACRDKNTDKQRRSLH